jgi:hypothetical protein
MVGSELSRTGRGFAVELVYLISHGICSNKQFNVDKIIAKGTKKNCKNTIFVLV